MRPEDADWPFTEQIQKERRVATARCPWQLKTEIIIPRPLNTIDNSEGFIQSRIFPVGGIDEKS